MFVLGLLVPATWLWQVVLDAGFGCGYIEPAELGDVDFNANISLSRSSISEAKIAYRFYVEDYYVGPSIHVNYEDSSYVKGKFNSGVGFVAGKSFNDSFIELSIQDNVISKRSFSEIQNLKIRYGVSY